MKQIIGLSCFFALASFVQAQGLLDPGSAPAASMRTLEEIFVQAEAAEDAGRSAESRLPITNIPMTITQPGSYYLTTNLTCTGTSSNGISVYADYVTLDLNGYTLTGANVFEGGAAVYQPSGYRGLAVLNGAVTLWKGSFGGLYMSGKGNKVKDVRAFENSTGIILGEAALAEDCLSYNNSVMGVYLNRNSVAKRCSADSNGDVGFSAGSSCELVDCSSARSGRNGIEIGVGGLLVRCLVYVCGEEGIAASAATVISECSVLYSGIDGIHLYGDGVVKETSVGNAGRNGVYVAGGIVRDCRVTECSTNGLVLLNGALAERCAVKDNGYQGISVEGDRNVIRDNLCTGNGSSGLFIQGKRNRVEGNHCAGNDFGLYFYDNGDLDRADNNIALRNTCANNTTANFFVGVSNRIAFIDDTGAFAGANDNHALP